MAWIELHQAVWTHRKTWFLADLLCLSETHAAAHVIRLWTWALDNAPDGVLPDSSAVLAEAAGWERDPELLIDALARARWIDWDGEHYRLHSWFPHRDKAMRSAWEAIRRRVTPRIFKRDGYRCVFCGATEQLEVDHRISIARGGDNKEGNLQTLCLPCNRRKGAN